MQLPTETTSCIALAGLFQATNQVHRIASIGCPDTLQVNACLGSVLNLNPEKLDDIYGSMDAIRPGLKFLRDVLGGRAPHTESLRLAIAVLQLERRFQRKSRNQQALGKELDLIAQSARDIENPSAAETVAQLADAWVQHVGGTQPKIMVSGNPNYLKDLDNQALIRALLLAALRAAVLWRQMGGSRWRLLWQRKHYQQVVNTLLAQD